MRDQILNGVFVVTYGLCILLLGSYFAFAHAMDAKFWQQQITDGDRKPIPDCSQPTNSDIEERAKSIATTPQVWAQFLEAAKISLAADAEHCGKFLTLMDLCRRALLAGDPSTQDSVKKQAPFHLSDKLLDHPDYTPTPEDIVLLKEALGRMPSGLAAVRGDELLDAAVK